MPKIIDLGVEIDHIETLTRANGVTAISELLWNALDADATEIHVDSTSNGIGGYDSITVTDNGSAIDYETAQEVFARIGGSSKKKLLVSPKGRSFHGREGKGRYKSLSLGDLVVFTSVYENKGVLYSFTITFDNNNLSSSEISDLKTLKKSDGIKPGFTVVIKNVNQDNVAFLYNEKNLKSIEQKFASYWINYPEISIYFNNKRIEFGSLIKNDEEIIMPIKASDSSKTESFSIKVIEWSIDISKKMYLCSSKGVPYREIKLGFAPSIPISIFIQSNYIENLHTVNKLDLYDKDELIAIAINEAKKYGKNYTRNRLHLYSREFIIDLKKEGIYPYRDEPENFVEESKRQVFDIVALQVNEYLPDFESQPNKNKKFTLALIKEALENNSESLQTILTEIIGLPKDKRDELAELLKDSTLSNIIDTMTEIRHRLKFVQALEDMIYDKDANKHVKERKHLHRILIQETWIFGDEYAYGVDDVTLKNVLKEYLKALGRDDFEEIVQSEDNSRLGIIPDVCLWRQFPQGTPGYKTNLIIELKKPSVNAGVEELVQIQLYANKIMKDRRFPKEKTHWKFILITKDIKSEIEDQMEQANRKYGHVTQGANHDVFVLTWGHIFNEARTRYEFIKDRLNINLMDDKDNLKYLHDKYSEYLPSDFLNEKD